MELTQDQRLMITQKSIAIMQNWGMSEQDIIKISGLEGIVKARHMERYKKDEAFPNKNSIYAHLEHILGIEETTRWHICGLIGHTVVLQNKHLKHLCLQKDKKPLLH